MIDGARRRARRVHARAPSNTSPCESGASAASRALRGLGTQTAKLERPMASDRTWHARTAPDGAVTKPRARGAGRGSRTPAALDAVAQAQRDILASPPAALTERIGLLESALVEIEKAREANGGVVPRESIRARQDAQNELERARKEHARYVSGEVAAAYYNTAVRYINAVRQCHDDTRAVGRIEDSLVSMSTEQQHKRYRARSDLDRTIRMALRVHNDGAQVQRHAIVDEFLSEFHGHEPPIFLMHGACVFVGAPRDTAPRANARTPSARARRCRRHVHRVQHGDAHVQRRRDAQVSQVRHGDVHAGQHCEHGRLQRRRGVLQLHVQARKPLSGAATEAHPRAS